MYQEREKVWAGTEAAAHHFGSDKRERGYYRVHSSSAHPSFAVPPIIIKYGAVVLISVIWFQDEMLDYGEVNHV